MNNPNLRLLILIILAAAILGGLWYFRNDLMPDREPQIPVEVETPVAEPVVEPGPVHPIEPTMSETSVERELQPLPDLDDSDAYFLLALIDVFGTELEPLLVNEGLIDKIVTTIDNLPRKHIAERLRPVGRLAGDFSVDTVATDDQYLLGAANYARYDAIVGLLDRADLDRVVENYRRFYPLFQESYVRLGYPNAYFNDRVVEVIDHLLETPELDEPILLVRPHVLYEFADPDLAALSAGQKLMLRMGGEHAASVKTVLRGLRMRLE